MARRPRRLSGAVTALALCVGLSAATAGVAWAPGPSGSDTAAPHAQGRAAMQASATALPTRVVAGEEISPRRTATVVMGGDLLWHNTVWQSAAEDHARTGEGDRFDFDPMFAWLKPVVESADLAICHEEVPFAAPGDPLRSYPVFAAPHQIARWIGSMGWDACTTASNHSMDAGVPGIVETADLLEAAGVEHVGTFRTPAERRRPVIVTTADGVRIGIVAATYGLNGFVLPAGQEWAVSQEGDVDGLLAQAHRARQAGADIVIAHCHWGTEYDHLPNADQLAIAERLTASADIDLVLGEHAHVVQPITRINGTWVVYGMGNMVAQSEVGRPSAYVGITVTFEFTEGQDGRWRATRAAYLPTQWNHYSGGHPIRIQRATGSRLASLRAAVNGLGHQPGLVED